MNPPLLVQTISKENCITPALPTAYTEEDYIFLYIHHHDYYVGNFRQKNSSAEGGIDETSRLFRWNSGCSPERNSELFSPPRNGSEWMLCKTNFLRGIPLRSVPFRASELTLPYTSECLGMNTFFRGITETVPSLFHGIFPERNSVPNPKFTTMVQRP